MFMYICVVESMFRAQSDS